MEALLVPIALLSAVSFATGIVLAPLALRGAGPIVGSTISVPTAAIGFALVSPLIVDWSAWRWEGALIFAATGAIFPSMVTLLSFMSNRRIGPNLTAALGNLSPIFAIGLAVILFGDVPRPLQILGVVAVVAGLSVLGLERVRRVPSDLWLLFLPVASAAVRGSTQATVKFGMTSWHDPFAAVVIAYAVSSLVLLVVRFAVVRPAEPVGKAAVWYVAVGIANGLGVLTLFTALSLGPVTLVAPIVACYPLATIVLDRLIHRSGALTRASMAGIAVSVAGIALILAV